MNWHIRIIPLIITFVMYAPMTGWAGANPNAPYCEHDPACWEPNDDPSTWYGTDCCRPVQNEPCPALDSPQTGSKIAGEESGSFMRGPIISMGGTVRTWYNGIWMTTAYESTSFHAKHEFVTGCGEGYVNAETVNPSKVPVDVSFGFAFPLDKFGFTFISASANIYSYTFQWGGKNVPIIINPARCRYHCGKGWEINATPCIRVRSTLWTSWEETGPGGSIRREGEYITKHDDVTSKPSKLIDFVWDHKSAKCFNP